MPIYSEQFSTAQAIALQSRVAGASERYGVSTSATAAQNVARFNQCLTENRFVTLFTPGQYQIGGSGQGGLLVPSNTTVMIGQGVELITATATFQPLIRNLNAHDVGTTLASGIVYGGGGHGYTGTINHTGIAALHPVGSWIAIGGLEQSDGNNKGYHGVYRVFSSSGPNSITYNMALIPPSGGDSQAGAVIRVANTNIRIYGGLWNGNDVGQAGDGYNDGDPRQFIIGIRNAQNVIVDGVSFLRGNSWSLGPNNVRDCTFRNLTGELLGNGTQFANAIIQGAGGSRNVLIENVQGDCEDNMCAWSLDSMTGGSVNYPNYDLGDVYGLTIRNVNSVNNHASIIALWGNQHAKFHDVLIDGVTGRCNQAAVQIYGGYAPTAMNNTKGGRIQIKNVSGYFGSSPVTIRSDGDWDHIEVDGIVNNWISGVGVPLIKLHRYATTQTIKRLTLRNLQGVITENRTAPIVEIGDSNVDSIEIDGLHDIKLSAGVSAIQHIGTVGSVKKMTVNNVHATAAASGDCFIVSCENTNATNALVKLTVRDCGFTGVDATGGLVRQATTGRVTRIRSDNNTMVNGENASGIVRDNGTNPATYDTVDVTTTA